MKNTAVLLVFLACLLASVASRAQDKSIFQNPIMAGFYPDPSICRVGEDYYMVHSTFAYFPGVPIFHSKDLVNWKQIGHVLNRPEQLNLDGQGVSRGIFAPTISYNKGTFYMITTLIDNGGNFVVMATNPAGPWSDPAWLPNVQGIDPSIYFDDDGKAYVIYNSDAPDNQPLYDGHRTLRMLEFDAQSLKTKGTPHLLVNGGVDITKKPVWIEGPHIYKVNGYYYLMAAEGGTSINHSEVILRSRNVTGPYIPYENNPILTQRDLPANRPNPITSTGHADLVDTPNGEWWAIFLACRPYDANDSYNTGRETFMAPVKWIDGWPVINPDFKEVQYSYTRPHLPEVKQGSFPLNGNFVLKDNFTNPVLAPYWVFLRTPRSSWYKISKAGGLSVKLRPETIKGKENPSFIARRQQHLYGSASTQLVFTPKAEHEFAGLVAYHNEDHFYTLGKTMKGSNEVLQLQKADGTVLAEKMLARHERKKPLYLKLTFEGNNYSFYYATKEGDWQLMKDKVDATYLSTRVAGGFVGVTLGMYATSDGNEAQNRASFTWFEYTGNDPVYKAEK